MTNMEAWNNVSRRLSQYSREHGFNHDDMEAEVLVFGALRGQTAREQEQIIDLNMQILKITETLEQQLHLLEGCVKNENCISGTNGNA